MREVSPFASFQLWCKKIGRTRNLNRQETILFSRNPAWPVGWQTVQGVSWHKVYMPSIFALKRRTNVSLITKLGNVIIECDGINIHAVLG